MLCQSTGILGGLLTGLFARKEICGTDGAFYGNGKQFLYQICGVGFAIGWSAILTFIILIFVDYTVGLRSLILPDEDAIPESSLHGGESSIDGSNHGISVLQRSIHGSKRGLPIRSLFPSRLGNKMSENDISNHGNNSGSAHGGFFNIPSLLRSPSRNILRSNKISESVDGSNHGMNSTHGPKLPTPQKRITVRVAVQPIS